MASYVHDGDGPFTIPTYGSPEPTNADRAERGEHAIQSIINDTRVDREDALSGLLCDLMHWADANKVDFNLALQNGQGNYREEVAYEQRK